MSLAIGGAAAGSAEGWIVVEDCGRGVLGLVGLGTVGICVGSVAARVARGMMFSIRLWPGGRRTGRTWGLGRSLGDLGGDCHCGGVWGCGLGSAGRDAGE